MIRYSLACDNDHAFESWFRNSDAFDEQSGRGLVVCPFCDSSVVGKAIMSPHIARTDRAPVRALPAPEVSTDEAAKAPEPKQPVALIDERHAALRTMMRELHAKIMETTVDVGARFPEEARRIHDSETPEQPIRGQATAEEARALIDEGIGVLPIPIPPDERN
ncbi:MAG: DUF1178 family protein [Beijerinckiaceae bacterium]